jgi:hypothetical protein
MKTVVAIIVYNRYENVERWINCWAKCDQTDAELVVIQSVDRYEETPIQNLCKATKTKYFRRLNKGMDIGAFAQVCRGEIRNFPDFDRLLWITDDTIPMRKDFVKWFTKGTGLNCMEIASKNAPLHVRITYLETKTRSANWGHKIRSEEIQKLPTNGYVLITNADNYHVPAYLEKMLEGFDSDKIVATYCSKMVHSYIGWKTIDCRLDRGYIDCAGVMLRNEVAKRVGWKDIESHSADWFFFNDIAKAYGAGSFKRVEGCLLIHN